MWRKLAEGLQLQRCLGWIPRRWSQYILPVLVSLDRVSQAGLVDPEKPSGDTTPKKILAAAKKACSLSPEEVLQEFKGVDEKDAPYYCHDLSYAHSLLTVGYKLADSRKVTLVKQITYKGQIGRAHV